MDAAPIRDLDVLLRSMEPVMLPDDYVFVLLDRTVSAPNAAKAMVMEDEGVTYVLTRSAADAAGLDYEFVGAWITLTVHSDLEAVGLTAAFANALAEDQISCNVIAGAMHDHLLVPIDRKHDAIAALVRLQRAAAERQA